MFGLLGVLFKHIFCHLTIELGREVRIVDVDLSGDSLLLIIATDINISKGIVFVVDALNSTIYFDGRFLLFRPLAFERQMSRRLPQLVVVQNFLQVEVLGTDSAVKSSGCIHGHLYVDITCSRLQKRFQCGLSLSVSVEGSCQLQVTDAGKVIRQFNDLIQEVFAGLRQGKLIHLQMPGWLLIPVLQPTVHININIFLGGGNQELRNVNHLVCSIDTGCYHNRPLKILKRWFETS